MLVSNNKKMFLITSLIAFVMIVFSFYVTVFDQVISQNQGFFYAVVFGGVLVLAFVLCNLFTKLLAISVTLDSSKLWRTISLCIFGGLCVLMLVTRLRYSCTLPPTDSSYVKAAVQFTKGDIVGSNDLITSLRHNPSEFVFSVVLSGVINIVGDNTASVVILNALFIIITALCVYFSVVKLTDRVCALIAACGVLLTPCQSFAIYSYCSDFAFGAAFFALLYIYISLFTENDELTKNKKIIYYVFGSLITGIVLLCEPVMLVFVILITIGFWLLNKNKLKDILVISLIGFAVLLILLIVKSLVLGIMIPDSLLDFVNSFANLFQNEYGIISDFSKVWHDFTSSVNSQNHFINDCYYFLYGSTGAAYTSLDAAWICLINQLLYMFYCVMALMCIIYALRCGFGKLFPVCAAFVGIFIMLLFQSVRYSTTFLFVTILVMFSSICLNYMYLNHHPELSRRDISQVINESAQTSEEVKNPEPGSSKNVDSADFVDRAKALILVGENDKMYENIKNAEKGEPTEKKKEEIPEPDMFKKESKEDQVKNIENTENTEKIENDVNSENSSKNMDNKAKASDSVLELPKVPKVEEVVNDDVAVKDSYFFDNEDKEDSKYKPENQIVADKDDWEDETDISKVDKVLGDIVKKDNSKNESSKNTEKGKPLHNPVKEPVKHEAKAMDYKVKSDKFDDDFDIDIDDDADWDY